MVLGSIDGDGDGALREEAEVRTRIRAIGVPIREEYDVDTLKNGVIYGTEGVIESALKQVMIRLHRIQRDSDPFLDCVWSMNETIALGNLSLFSTLRTLAGSSTRFEV